MSVIAVSTKIAPPCHRRANMQCGAYLTPAVEKSKQSGNISHAISTRRKGNETIEMDECIPARRKWSGVLATCRSDYCDFHRIDRSGDDHGGPGWQPEPGRHPE